MPTAPRWSGGTDGSRTRARLAPGTYTFTSSDGHDKASPAGETKIASSFDVDARARRQLNLPHVLEVLRTRYPEQFHAGQARTLQRRFRDWRARHGVEPEVFFEQVAVPGREAAIDFTHATDLGVTIAGDPFPHLLFEFVLSYSHWTWVAIAFGEIFEALAASVQGALWALGGVPDVLRSDNLSAATHELKASNGRDLTPRFRAVLEHYGMRSSRITPGQAHENGVAEQAHRRLKSLIAQALLVRGHAAFDTVAAYDAFVQEVVAYWRNRPAAARVAEERSALRALPSATATSSIWSPCSIPISCCEPMAVRWPARHGSCEAPRPSPDKRRRSRSWVCPIRSSW